MKIKDGFVMKNIGGRDMAVSSGDEYKKNRFIITLNGTSKFIWEKLAAGCSEDELCAAMLDTYDVEETVLRRDIGIFLDKLRNEGILLDD